MSGVGIVYQNNKCGMVDTQGKLITPLKYKSLRVVHDGVVRAELNGKFGLLDTSGREITEFKYDDMNLVATEEFISVKFNNKEGYLNMKGEVVIPIIYDLSLIHISEPTRRTPISYAVFCLKKIFLMIRRPPRSTPLYSSAASDVYKRQPQCFQNPV